ncbi:MAG: hypothetical protein FWG31_00895 [Oscillospiraceae bacterium]|nr:hypothetical protein [Oscillospiraceae bacterium]
MNLTAKEMNVLCAFHAGTLSETICRLRKKADEAEPPETKVIVKSLIDMLLTMKDGEAVSLSFTSEE